jgi:hypothetical protein
MFVYINTQVLNCAPGEIGLNETETRSNEPRTPDWENAAVGIQENGAKVGDVAGRFVRSGR